MDQAERLRSLVNERASQAREYNKNMRIIAVTSGKGGVGKTNFAVNLAIHLARAGKKVIVIDADLALPMLRCFWG
jgi:flagellar biosynthesis protein FlhG